MFVHHGTDLERQGKEEIGHCDGRDGGEVVGRQEVGERRKGDGYRDLQHLGYLWYSCSQCIHLLTFTSVGVRSAVADFDVPVRLVPLSKMVREQTSPEVECVPRVLACHDYS